MIFAGTFFAELLLLFLLSKQVTGKISQFFYHATRSRTATINLIALLFFPGTVIHELSHFLMAALLFVPVGNMEFWPKIENDDNVKLGSVQIAESDIFRRFLIGAAPFLLGVLFLLGLLYLMISQNWLSNPWIVAAMIYVAFQIGNTMFSSKKDMEGALELFGVVLFFIVVFYFLGVRIPSFNPSLFFDHPTVTEVFKQGSLFLLVPLGLDILVLVLLRLFGFKRL
jgi:hypothetical protein